MCLSVSTWHVKCRHRDPQYLEECDKKAKGKCKAIWDDERMNYTDICKKCKAGILVLINLEEVDCNIRGFDRFSCRVRNVSPYDT